MKVLVTGATGFVGSHAVRRLLAAGHELRLLARTPDKVGPLMEKMKIDVTALEVVKGDITDEASVQRAVEGCDAVVHTAAVVALDPTFEASMKDTNLLGTTNVLGAAVGAGCDPIIHLSSAAALFPFQTDPVTADHPVMGEGTVYGQTKAACETLARRHQDDGSPVVTLYPSAIMGPDDWNESINLASFVMWLEKGFPRTKGFTGSYVDVRDLAEIIAASMVAGRGPRRYLAFGTYLNAESLVAAMEEAIGAKVKTVPLPKPAWWVWGRIGNLARRFGKDLVLTSDGFDFIFKSKPGDDSATVEATGVEFRPVAETFADTFRWMHHAGHVRAEKVGVLADN